MRNQDGRENKTDGAMKSRDKAKNENEMEKKGLKLEPDQGPGFHWEQAHGLWRFQAPIFLFFESDLKRIQNRQTVN